MTEQTQIKRAIVIEANAEHLERLRKTGATQGFQVLCDERERTGGDGTAPTPLAYFCLSVGF